MEFLGKRSEVGGSAQNKMEWLCGNKNILFLQQQRIKVNRETPGPCLSYSFLSQSVPRLYRQYLLSNDWLLTVGGYLIIVAQVGWAHFLLKALLFYLELYLPFDWSNCSLKRNSHSHPTPISHLIPELVQDKVGGKDNV